MTRRVSFLGMILTVTIIVPAAVGAQDLLSNQHFNSNLSGWVGAGWWDAEDCFADPKSGSAAYENQISGFNSTYVVRQCVELPASGQLYRLSGYLKVPAGQTGTGWAQIGLAWYSSGGCAVASLLDGADTSVNEAGSWQQRSRTVAAPYVAVSAYVYAINQKTSDSGEHKILVDELSFTMLDSIFRNGFESGNLTAWSASVP